MKVLRLILKLWHRHPARAVAATVHAEAIVEELTDNSPRADAFREVLQTTADNRLRLNYLSAEVRALQEREREIK